MFYLLPLLEQFTVGVEDSSGIFPVDGIWVASSHLISLSKFICCVQSEDSVAWDDSVALEAGLGLSSGSVSDSESLEVNIIV